jgi:BASS family bile acid:Na+ symporter
MHDLMGFLQATLSPLILVFTVLNLAAMGLQALVPEVLKVLRNRKVVLLVVFWGWVVGPAVGYLITRLLPLAEPFAVVVLLTSLAPCAPFLQQVVAKARGDVAFAGALIPLVSVGTVVFMPLLGPHLVHGIAIDAGAIAKPLVTMVLLPLAIGAALRNYADELATRIFPIVKLLALVSTFLTTIWCLALYGESILNTAGSLALASMTLFMIGMGILPYWIGFGLRQNQRSVLALGMSTRNIAAVFATVSVIPNADRRLLVMVIMWTLWSLVIAAFEARIFGRKAVDAATEAAA